MSPQDPGFTTGGAGVRGHGDIWEAPEGWGRKHRRTYGGRGADAHEAAGCHGSHGGIMEGGAVGLGDLVRNRWGTHGEARGPSRTHRPRRSWDTLGKRGAWFNWVLLHTPSLSPVSTSTPTPNMNPLTHPPRPSRTMSSPSPPSVQQSPGGQEVHDHPSLPAPQGARSVR